jgi:hypothetical protein
MRASVSGMATTTDAQIAKLPKWAQHRIALLEQDLEAARSRLAAGPDESRIFADPFDDNRPLGTATTVRFYPHEDQPDTYVDVVITAAAGIRLTASDWMSVRPSASNAIMVDVRDPRRAC